MYSSIAFCVYFSDMSMCLWDTLAEEPLLNKYEHHTEFVLGCDFNLFHEGQIASCSWDSSVVVWNIGEQPTK
jgi:peroxin-7